MTELLWTCLNTATKENTLLEPFNSAKKPLSFPANLKSFLTQVEKKLNNQFKIPIDKFSAEQNKPDEKDKINLNKLTFEAFQRRLGNLILESIYIKQNEKSSLSEFLKKYWSEFPSARVSRQFEKFKPYLNHEKPFPFDLNSDLSDNPLDNNIDALNMSEVQVQDTYRKTSSPGGLEINQALEEFRKESEKNMDYLSVVQVVSPGSKLNKNKKDYFLDKGGCLVINETNESDKSSKPKSPDFTLSHLAATKEQFKEFSGLGSKIESESEEISQSENQKSSILDILNVKNLNNQGKHNIKQDDIPSEISSFIKIENPEISDIFEDLPCLSPWFLLTISGNEKKFRKIFKTFCGNGELIKTEDLGNLFLVTLRTLKIFPYDHYREMFRKVSEGLYPARYASLSKKIVKPRINFNEFIEIMNVWGEGYQKERGTVLGYTIRVNDFFRTFAESQNKDLGFELGKIVKGLSCLISDHQVKKTQDLPESSKKNLEDIFQFYGKIQKIQGHEGTFEAVEASNSSWNLGKFLKFCGDFNIALNKQQDNRGVTKENLIILFKKFASNTRVMSFQQFLEALDSIAEQMYSLEYDKRFFTEFGYKSVSEKRKLLNDYLELNNFQKVQSKKQTFRPKPVFEFNKPSLKIDLKNKVKISPRLLQDLEGHKHLPKISSLKKPLAKVLSPQPKIEQSQKLLCSDGYSKRFRTNFQQVKSERNILNFQEEKEGSSKSKSPVFNEKITLSSLKSLSKNLDVDLDVKELIINESYELFDRLYQLDISKRNKNN